MSRIRVGVAALAVLAAGALGAFYHRAAEPAPADAKEEKAGAEAAVRKTAEAFAAAFGKGDAPAVAALWTKTGEYVGPDGEVMSGRGEIEKGYAAYFKAHPGSTAEVKVESVRLLGEHTAIEEGTLRVTSKADGVGPVCRYSALHVREGDAWKMASVREWVPDPASLVTLKDVEWLVGEWTAKAGDSEASVTYAWDEDGSFLRGWYVLKRGGKKVASGSQMIAKDPGGGLRSWQFDAGGATGEWAWTREGDAWVIEAVGVLPDGGEVTAVNLLVPVGKDGFTWQSVERTVAGEQLPSTPPVKATRAKAGK